MKTRLSLWLVGAALAIVAVAVAVPREASLVEKLAAPTAAERDAAAKELLALGKKALPELREAVQLVERSRERWAGSRVAVLVARELDFGIARMFSVFAEQIEAEYAAFRDEASARAWLAEMPAT